MNAQADIVLATCNARYAHCAHALRCLLANLGDLRARTLLMEATLDDDPVLLAERILALRPRLVGLSAAVWNIEQICDCAEALSAAPDRPCIIAGGPEVTATDPPPRLRALCDCLVVGEGEIAFAEIATQVLAGGRPEPLIIAAAPDLATLADPYPLYEDDDLAHRLVYAETARGCPYTCGFCSSARDERVRPFPWPALVTRLATLIARGPRVIKFLDRSPNALPGHCEALLDALSKHHRDGTSYHLELVPDRFPAGLRERIAAFPAGALQLEIGLQSLDPKVLAACGRKTDLATALEALRFLRTTAAHLHVDLIVGLPGEDLAGFLRGFDRLWALRPQEIQVGILKRLRGTPFADGALDPAYRFATRPPYALLANPWIDFPTVCRLRRFARAFDLFVNRGEFPTTIELLMHEASPGAAFLGFTDALYTRFGRGHAIRLDQRCAALRDHLRDVHGHDDASIIAAMHEDMAQRASPKGLPDFLRAPRHPRPDDLRHRG